MISRFQNITFAKNFFNMSDFRYENFLTAGLEAEQKIIKTFGKFLAGSKEEDFKGIDLKLTFNFDVKKAKKIRRSDDAPSYFRTWIEYKNVRGEAGSICKEDIDFFLIEGLSVWLVKSRYDTLNLYKKHEKDENGNLKPVLFLEDTKKIQLYQPYQRKDRQDIIMLVEINNPDWPTKMSIPKNKFNQ